MADTLADIKESFLFALVIEILNSSKGWVLATFEETGKAQKDIC